MNSGFKESFNLFFASSKNNYNVLDDLSKQHELQADLFAAALLLPKAMLKKALVKLKSKEELARFFSSEPSSARTPPGNLWVAK